jgi:hypothetical protein
MTSSGPPTKTSSSPSTCSLKRELNGSPAYIVHLVIAASRSDPQLGQQARLARIETLHNRV